ncbi:MAG: DUF1931 family protein [Xanthobacteraceae bacterium]
MPPRRMSTWPRGMYSARRCCGYGTHDRCATRGHQPAAASHGGRAFRAIVRRTAGIDVDKMDLRRYSNFVNSKLHDLLVVGEEAARLNGRKTIEPFHLPITKGLQDCIRKFRELDEEVELDPILDQLAARPQLGLPYAEDMEAFFPAIVGGLSVALAHSFKIVDPKLKNPSTQHCQRSFQIFELLL